MKPKMIITFCSCGAVHSVNCPIPVLQEIKQRVCRERGIVNYIPDDVADEIDRLVAEEMAHRKARQ